MKYILVMMSVLTILGCDSAQNSNSQHYHITIDGMDCVGVDYRNLSCNWDMYEGHKD